MSKSVSRCLLFTILLGTLATIIYGQDQVGIDVLNRPNNCRVKSRSGNRLTMHYTGTFVNGKMFDSSRNPGRQPFTFRLGAGEVIRGWDLGLLDMCVGERRKLTIPYSLAYGEAGRSGIPPRSTLIFDTELLNIE